MYNILILRNQNNQELQHQLKLFQSQVNHYISFCHDLKKWCLVYYVSGVFKIHKRGNKIRNSKE